MKLNVASQHDGFEIGSSYSTTHNDRDKKREAKVKRRFASCRKI